MSLVEPRTENSSPGALAPAVVRGSTWSASGAMLSRIIGLLAQVALGLLLSDHDFGIYAVAIGVSNVLTVLRDGGARQLLVARPADYDRLLPPVFWMAMVFALGTAGLLAASTLLVARQQSEIGTLLLIIALAQPIGIPGAILSARLQIEMRFGALTAIASTLSVIRFGGAVLLAWLGLGPLSFVLPLIPMALLEWAWAWALTRDTPWLKGANPALWRSLLGVSGWAVAGSAGIAAINGGVPVVLKLIVPTGVIGLYFFAQQLVAQAGIVLGASLAQVLFPAFTHLRDDPERKKRAILRALRQSTLLASPLCAGMAAVIVPFEALIWGGKWAAAADSVVVMALAYPINIIAAIPVAVQQSRAQFRAWGLGVNAIALATFAGAAWMAIRVPEAYPIAVASSLAMAISTLAYTLWALRPIGITPTQVIGAIAPGWALGSLAAWLAILADRILLPSAPLSLRVIMGGVVFLFSFAAMIRVCVPEQIRESVEMLPTPIRPMTSGLLRLRLRETASPDR